MHFPYNNSEGLNRRGTLTIVAADNTMQSNYVYMERSKAVRTIEVARNKERKMLVNTFLTLLRIYICIMYMNEEIC